MVEFRDALGAVPHPPRPDAVRLIDRVLAKLCDRPDQWAASRLLSKELGPDDVVFSVSEDMTLPLILWLQLRRSRAKVVTSVMNPGRLRMKVLFRAFNAKRRVARFLTLTPAWKRSSATRSACRRPSSSGSRWRPTSDSSGRWSAPAMVARCSSRRGSSSAITRPLPRQSTDLDVEVEVCATSPNASSRTRAAIPEQLPRT